MAQWRHDTPVILPSMLMCDFGNLTAEVRRLEAAGIRGFHLDVMDGHFVPNLTYGMPIVSAMRAVTKLPLDVHLMISEPQRYVEDFVAAGADVVTIHAEAVTDPGPVLRMIRRCGAAAGLAINPPTPVSTVERALGDCDVILVMSVMPGFGGQEFDSRALEKLAYLRRTAAHLCLAVDGGVNATTIRACVEAGSDLLVVGSAIFGHDDYGQRIAMLRGAAAGSDI